ncbi:MAG TPA: Ig-like domain-containing protein [Patescibacteria group bacterium]
MHLPDVFSEDKGVHLTLLFLAFVNLLLLIVFFVLVVGPFGNFPSLIPLSDKVPVVRLSLVSPPSNTAVSSTTPLILTLSNSPTIQKAELQIDGKVVQTVFTQQTGKLTLYWDTTRHQDGVHNLLITTTDQKGGRSTVIAKYEVKNNITRSVSN